MDIRSIMSKLDNIESLTKQSVSEALTLNDVQATEKAAADKAASEKQGGFLGGIFKTSPETAGDVALAKLAAENNLPGLFNSKGEFVVADNKRMDRGPMGQEPTSPVQKAPPTPSDYEPLAQLGLIPDNAKGPAGLTNFLSGGKADANFKSNIEKSTGARKQQAIDALVGKIEPALAKQEQKYAQVKKESYTSGIAKALAESIGYSLLSELESPEVKKAQAASNTPTPGEFSDDPEMQQLADLMAQTSGIDDPKVKALQDRYSKLLAAIEAGKKDAAGQSATPSADSSKPVDDNLKKEKMKQALDLLNKFKAAVFKRNQNDPLLKDKATSGALPKSMSESEIIANLRQKLEAYDQPLTEAEIIAKIEQRMSTVDVNPLSEAEVAEIAGLIRGLGTAAKAGWQGLKNIGSNFAGGLKGAATSGGRTATGQFAKATPAAKIANKAGKAIAKNPVKTAVASTAAGTALGYNLADKGADTTVAQDQKPNRGQSATPTTPTTPTAPEAPTAPEVGGDDDIKAMRDQLNSYKDGELATLADDPEVAKLIKDIESALKNEQDTNKYSLNFGNPQPKLNANA